LFLAVVLTPVIVWMRFGEPYLAHTERLPADTLVVESWVQEDGLHAAAAEFRSGGYRHLVTTGGLTGSKGTKRRRSYTAISEKALVDAGIAKDEIIAADMPDVDTQRTHAMALGAQRALKDRGITPRSINVFTEGTHARRSRLVYARVFGPDVRVGVISWLPWESSKDLPWWTSSERTLTLIKETLGYPYEVLFKSGRDD
jgi:hypothetical protein